MSVKHNILFLKSLLLMLVSAGSISAQCTYTNNYSSSAGWAMNGCCYTIGPSGFVYTTTPGAAYNYATHPLNCTLSNTAWTGDVDFIYTGRGAGGTGHTILAATAGTNEWLNIGPSYAHPNEDAIAVYIVSPYGGPQSTDSLVGVSKSGTVENTLSKGIALNMFTQYYVRLQRISGNQGKLSLFTDAARTIHAPGSPQYFPIACTVDSLNTVEHGVLPQGWYTRTLDAVLTNLVIKDDSASSSNIAKDTTVCSSPPILLNAGAATSYTWSTGSNAQSISVSTSGTYWVELQSSTGCEQTDTIHVSFVTPPTVNVLTDTTICNNVNYVLNATQTNATGYTWSTGATTPSIVPSASGVYWVAINFDQCIVIDSTNLTVLNAPVVSLPNYTVCTGQTISITPVVSGGSGTYFYNWSTGFTGSSYSTTPVLDSTYMVSVTDANGCFTPVFTGSITVLAPLTVTVNGLSTCSADTVSLKVNVSGGNGNYIYTWQPSNSHQNPIKVIPQSNTIYTVTVSDGCTVQNATDTAQIVVTPTPVINLPNGNSGCKPVCINLTNISYNLLSNWQWNFGDGHTALNQKPDYCYTNTGTYHVSLSYTTALGCVKTIGLASPVVVLPSPTAVFSASAFETDIFNTDIHFYNESINYISSQWYLGDGATSVLQNPSHVYAATGDYEVMLIVKNTDGCVDTAKHEVQIKDVFTFYAPNTFTPNEDNLNELFLPVGTGWDKDHFTMSVYDRWGNLILNTSDSQQGWNGQVKGQIAQQDTYVWKVELKDVYNKLHAYSGIISLIK